MRNLLSKFLTSAFGVLIGCTLTYGQNEEDALRYTERNLQGTARFNALGGAFGALGADLTVVSINPAGLARFNKSEVSFTPGLYMPSTTSTYNNGEAYGSATRLRMSNVGLVGASRTDNDAITPWRSIQFGITYNRLNIFDNDIQIAGENTNSMLAVFAQQATGTPEANIYEAYPFTSALAYEAYLIDPYIDSTGSTYYQHRIPSGNINQFKSIEERGGMNETALTFSGNYEDKVYLGVSVGFPRIRYERTTRHNENPLLDTVGNEINSFTFREDLSTSGIGVNAKVGVIYLPVDWVRIGLAVHTPSAFSMSDSWATSMTASHKNGDYYSVSSDPGSFTYVLRTPGRIVGSAAVIIAKRGLVSMDYEFSNYPGAKLRSDRYSNYEFENENAVIDNEFTAVNEVRIGTEWRIIKGLSARAGFNYRTSPFVTGITESDSEMMAISAGFGYRKTAWYADLSYTHRTWSEDHYLYDPVLVNPATINNNHGFLTITVGARY